MKIIKIINVGIFVMTFYKDNVFFGYELKNSQYNNITKNEIELIRKFIEPISIQDITENDFDIIKEF